MEGKPAGWRGGSQAEELCQGPAALAQGGGCSLAPLQQDPPRHTTPAGALAQERSAPPPPPGNSRPAHLSGQPSWIPTTYMSCA